MVPMAPSATITRVDRRSRNCRARVVEVIVMGTVRKSRLEHGNCDIYQLSARGKGYGAGKDRGRMVRLHYQHDHRRPATSAGLRTSARNPAPSRERFQVPPFPQPAESAQGLIPATEVRR